MRRKGPTSWVFLDITASHEGRATMIDVVKRTAEVIFMPLTVGGGIRTIEDIRALLNAGATKCRSIRRPARIQNSCGRPGSGLGASASW